MADFFSKGQFAISQESQYLDLIKKILAKQCVRKDRTGTGTKSVFGEVMRFSLAGGVIPLLTTKKVPWKSVVEELLWMIKGSTSAQELASNGVNIWNANATREALDKAGLKDREVGDLGPIYGFQWRHSGAEYKTMHDDYTGQGVDQLAECIHKIKTNPTDRRLYMTSWNPKDLKLMALPPCHVSCQFYVDDDGNLSSSMYQRSCDMGLGVPFNIASYSLLTHLVAHVCGLKPGEFIYMMGDTHIYLNHIEKLKQQLEREPRAFPIIEINAAVTDIDKFTYEDIKLIGYDPHPAIKMEMSV